MTKAEITIAIDLSANRFPKDDPIRMHVSYARAAYKMINLMRSQQQFEGVFPITPDSVNVNSQLDIDGETVHRFIFLYQEFYKNIVKPNKTRYNKINPVQLPIFCTDNERRRNVVTQDAINARNRSALDSFIPSGDESLRSFRFDSEAERVAQGNALSQFRGMKVNIDPTTPVITNEERNAFLERMASRTTYLYNDRQRQNTFFFAGDSDVKHVLDSMTKANKARDALPSSEELDVEHFEQLQRDINNCSAAGPSWDECLKQLDLRIEDLKSGQVDKLTKQAFRIFWRGLQLFPWQPQGIAFGLQMLRSPL